MTTLCRTCRHPVDPKSWQQEHFSCWLRRQEEERHERLREKMLHPIGD